MGEVAQDIFLLIVAVDVLVLLFHIHQHVMSNYAVMVYIVVIAILFSFPLLFW